VPTPPKAPEAPKPPPKDALTIELEKITSTEDKAKDLKETYGKFKAASGKAKAELLRSFIDAVELPKDDGLTNIDGETSARTECQEKSLFEVSARAKKPYQAKQRDHNGGGGYGKNQHVNRTDHNQERRPYRERNDGGFKRIQETSEERKEKAKLKADSERHMAAVKADKNDVQKVRILLNQITQENYITMKEKLKRLIFGDRKTFEEQAAKLIGTEKEELKQKLIASGGIQKEIEDIVVSTIFRKAVQEKIYCGFYATLCSDIVRMELEMKGLEPVQKNFKECGFRSSLLQNCSNQFQEVFAMGAKLEELTDFDDQEKLKEKLFGNIYFIGELYKEFLLPEKIVVMVQMNLLGLDENQKDNKQLSHHTLDAGLMFINKVGLVFDERTASSIK